MIKPLVKTGDLVAVVITKETLARLGIEGNEIEMLDLLDAVILRKPGRRTNFDEAMQETLTR